MNLDYFIFIHEYVFFSFRTSGPIMNIARWLKFPINMTEMNLFLFFLNWRSYSLHLTFINEMKWVFLQHFPQKRTGGPVAPYFLQDWCRHEKSHKMYFFDAISGWSDFLQSHLFWKIFQCLKWGVRNFILFFTLPFIWRKSIFFAGLGGKSRLIGEGGLGLGVKFLFFVQV